MSIVLPSRIPAANVDPPVPIPIHQLKERLRSFEQISQDSGRYGYRFWNMSSPVFGLTPGDVVKVDLRANPKFHRGELVCIEHLKFSIFTVGGLKSMRNGCFEVLMHSEQYKQGNLSECLLRKVIGKLDQEPVQRIFLMRYYKSIKDETAGHSFRDVLRPRPDPAKPTALRDTSLLAHIISRAQPGRILQFPHHNAQ